MTFSGHFFCLRGHKSYGFSHSTYEALLSDNAWSCKCPQCGEASLEAFVAFAEEAPRPCPRENPDALLGALVHLVDVIESAENDYWTRAHMQTLAAMARDLRDEFNL